MKLNHRSLRPRATALAVSIAALLASSIVSLPTSASAADITWGAPTTISANTDVSLHGSLLGAFNLGDTAAGSPVINGVTFKEFVLGVGMTTSSSGNFTFSAATAGALSSANSVGAPGVPPFNSLSASYRTLLGSAGGAGIPNVPLVLTMNGLINGATYEFQWWANISSIASTSSTTATSGNTVTLDWNNTNSVGGIGQFALGTFTADSASESITFTDPGNQALLNGFQLRITGVKTAYWTGDQGNAWNTNAAGNTNWATDATGATDTGIAPTAMTDVFFSASGATNQSTVLNQDFTIHSLTINDPAAVTISGARTLTIANDPNAGITVYAGAGLFTIGTNTTLNFTGTAPTFTVDNDAGAIVRGVITGSNGLIKDGTGELTLTNDNTYTGGTTIKNGLLSIGNHGTTGSILGDVEVDATGVLIFDRTNSYTYSGAITGDGEVRILGTGTTTLNAASSSYGSLSVRAGTLVLDGGDTMLTSTGNRPLFVGRDTADTPQLLIQNGAHLHSQQGLTSLVTGASGTGVTVDGATSSWQTGGQLVIGRNDFAAPHNFGFVTVQNAATLTNNGNIFVGDEGGNGTLTVQSGGTVQTFGAGIVGRGAGSIGTATVTGAGSSWTVSQDLRLGGFDSGDFGGTATLNVLAGGSVSVAGRTKFWTSGSSITANGGTFITGSLTNLAGTTPTIAISDPTPGVSALQVGSDFTDSVFSGQIVNAAGGAGSVLKTGPGVLTLTGASTYTGGTTITGGALFANNTAGSATGTGPVVINTGAALGGNGNAGGAITLNSGGFIAPGATTGISVSTLKGGSLLWNGGGELSLDLGTTSDLLALTGTFTKGTAGSFTVEIANAGGLGSQTHYTLVTFGSNVGFTAADFTLGSFIPGLTGAFTLTGTELDLDIIGLVTGGPIIQNSAPVGTPVFADFIVSGPVTTGGPTENNVIHTLSFTSGSSLLIHNTLFVTQGPVTLPGGATITLDGSLSTSQLQMLLGSLLNGNGNILGNLVNGGLVSPGHSPGQIHVSGDYTQSPSGTLRIEIAGRDLARHDLLSVGGKATLGGTLQLVPLDGFKLKRHKPVTFLTANGGVSGEFATVENGLTSDTILEPTVVYHQNSVTVEAVQGSFAALPGLTPNQKSVARALDHAATDRRADAIYEYLDYRKLNKLPGDFDKIAPEELTSIFTIGTSLAQVQSGNIQRRNDDIRSGTGGFSAAGLALNGTGPSYSGSFGSANSIGHMSPVGPISSDDGKDVKETKDVVAPAENRWGAFLSGTGEWVSVGNTDNARGYDLSSGGFTLGLDYKVTPNLAIGLAAGYTGTTADLTDRGRVWVNGGKLGLYATFFDYQRVTEPASTSKDAKEVQSPVSYDQARGFYADVAVFGGYNSYDSRRSALQGEARGDTDGGELNVLAGIGYDFKSGGLTFGPTASFNYTYIGTNDFTEHGSLAPLNVHGGEGESLRTAFGLKASYDWKVGSVLIKPELRAAWQHEFGDAAYDLSSSFANGAGNSLLVNGPQLGRDSVLLGAGFAIQFNERCSTYFYYDGELGRKNYQSTSVTGGMRLAF